MLRQIAGSGDPEPESAGAGRPGRLPEPPAGRSTTSSPCAATCATSSPEREVDPRRPRARILRRRAPRAQRRASPSRGASSSCAIAACAPASARASCAAARPRPRASPPAPARGVPRAPARGHPGGGRSTCAWRSTCAPQGEAILGTTAQPEAVRASACCAVQNLWLAAARRGRRRRLGQHRRAGRAARRAASCPPGSSPSPTSASATRGVPRAADARRDRLAPPRRPLDEVLHAQIAWQAPPDPATTALQPPPGATRHGRVRIAARLRPGGAQHAARAHQDRLAKPPGSLGPPGGAGGLVRRRARALPGATARSRPRWRSSPPITAWWSRASAPTDRR